MPRSEFAVDTTTPTAATATGRLGLLVLLLALPACGGNRDTLRPIETTRTVELVGEELRLGATTAERFGLRPMAASSPSPHWTTPPGWKELEPTSMRPANFQVAGDENAQCYLTLLPGDGGGLAANVNRWRRQMSLPPEDPAALANLPQQEFFGGGASFVDMRGTFTETDGVGEGFRLVGLLRFDAGSSAFLKMVGPASVIDRELESFLALARSFHIDEEPHGEGRAAGPTSATAPASAFRWKVPEGWRLAPARAMREVSFHVGADDSSECYVAVLGGDAGGVLANVNRWRNQLGHAPISEVELASLPRVNVLGRESTVVEVAGHFAGQGGEDVPEAMLYGVICLLPNRAVFVKMVGPRKSLETQREAFLEFCRSLESTG